MVNSNNKIKKIAVVSHFLAHYREPIFRLLSQQCAPQPVYVFISDQQSNIASLKTIDIKKADLPPEKGGIRWRFVRNYWIRSLLWQSGMLRLATSKEFDAIIYLGDVHFLSTWISCSIGRLMGKRVLMWTHGFLSREVGLKRMLRTSFYKLSHGLLLYGNRAARICHEFGFNKDSLYVVFNSLDYQKQIKLRKHIDTKMISQFRQKTFANSKWPILIATCRLTPKKKLDMLINSVSNLAKKGINVNALIVGDGPDRDYLEQLSTQKNTNDRVLFWGACHSEEQLALFFTMADICVMPGEVGLTCLHSFAYGTPVITHSKADFQGPEFEAILSGKTGDLFKHNDQTDLEEKIVKWLDIDEMRMKTKAACYEVIEKFYNPEFQCSIINKAVRGIKVKYHYIYL
ncbi:MAG: glycosyltransferase [Desulfamplus sp.]